MEVRIIRICSLGLSALLLAGYALSPASANHGNDPSALQRFVEARLAESSDQLQTAASLYAESLKEQPDNLLLAERAYVNAVEVGDFDLALKATKTLQLRGDSDPEMPLYAFADAFARRDWNGAELAIVELEALKNFSFMDSFLEAWLGVAKGQDSSVALARANENSTARYYLEEQQILNLLATRQEDEAYERLAKLVEQNETRMAPVRIIASRHFWAIGDQAKAKDMLQNGSSGPERRMLRFIDTGKKKGVARKVDASIGLAFLFQRLSNDLAAQRAQFLAQVMAQAGRRIAKKSDYAHLVLGSAFAGAGNISQAVQAYSRISAQSPYYLAALSAEISSLVGEGEHAQAIARLDTAIKNDSDTPELYILKGQSLQAQGDNEAAAGVYQIAISLAETLQRSDAILASYWLALGGAQEQAELWPEGLRSLEKANQLLPNSPTILNYLGYAQLERRENQDAAILAIKQAHELRSSSPAITDSLGWAYFLTGDHQRAVGYLESALAGQPQDPTINEHLGDAYWTVGREFEARYAWKSAKLFAEGEDLQRLVSKIDLGLRPDLVSP